MTWQNLLAARRAKRHKTSRQELDGLRAIVERDLKDAAVAGLSEDRRFATAYNAVLQLATMASKRSQAGACPPPRNVAGIGYPKHAEQSPATLWGGAEPTDRGDSTSVAPPTREHLPVCPAANVFQTAYPFGRPIPRLGWPFWHCPKSYDCGYGWLLSFVPGGNS